MRKDFLDVSDASFLSQRGTVHCDSSPSHLFGVFQGYNFPQLYLQDVFFDSKNILPLALQWNPLPRNSADYKNKFFGRMKFRPDNKNHTDKRLQIYVNASEFKSLYLEFKASGFSSISAYLRRKIVGKGKIIQKPKDLLSRLDSIGTELQRMGNNMNQIAKKAHLMENEGILST